MSLGTGKIEGLADRIHPLMNGRNLAGKPHGVLVIDMTGLTEGEIKAKSPTV